MTNKTIFMVLISLKILIAAQETTDQEQVETNRSMPYRKLPYCPSEYLIFLHKEGFDI
jgi:hypothetical protein